MPLLSMAQEARLAPFYHGVASGDPLSDRVIIWTRVTPPDEDISEIPVRWQIATDVDMTSIVASGDTITDYMRDFTVKVDVSGLSPGTTYYYNFYALGKNSITGRTKTTPVGTTDFVKFAVVSCSNYQAGYFNAYGRIAEKNDLDAVIHLGDYIYEYSATGDDFYGNASLRDKDRAHFPDKELNMLGDYRARYAQYRLDPDLRAAHQQHPFINVWDDHESANDAYDGGAENHNDGEGPWMTRLEAAKKAYEEWIPVRSIEPLYRNLEYGDLVDLIMLDTRIEAREQQINDVTNPALYSPTRTLLGAQQFDFLIDELKSSTAKWKLLGNQVIFSDFVVAWAANGTPGFETPEVVESIFLDIWDGYPYERQRIIDSIGLNNIDNVVILTGDFHSGFAFDVADSVSAFSTSIFGTPVGTPEYDGETQAGSIAVEFATPSISAANFDENLDPATSAGFEFQINNPLPPSAGVFAGVNPNPHMKYAELDKHGYFTITLTDSTAHADFYVVDDILTRTTGESVDASFVTLDGENKLTPRAVPAPAGASAPVAPGDPIREVITPNNGISLTKIGGFDTGLGEGAAEISAYHPQSERLYVVNAVQNSVDIVDISTISEPVVFGTIDATQYGAGANSVAVIGDYIAVAVEAINPTDSGSVVIYDIDGNYIDDIVVGALPDMVTGLVSASDTLIFVAIEGEPSDDYTIDPKGGVEIIDITDISNPVTTSLRFDGFDSTTLVTSGVRIFGPGASVATDLEPEYITISPNLDTAYAICQENNALVVIDIAGKSVEAILPLGYKDHSAMGNGLDPSDRDGGISIRNWPLLGMYQPDAIAAFEIGGQVYIATANEGDARDYDGFSEEIRFGDLGDPEETTFDLDPTLWPDGDMLKENIHLGRINITTATGDTDGDGDLDVVYSYGGRSFSIWNGSTGALVWDSGDDFEQIIANTLPDFFNGEYDPDIMKFDFESRSDNKGGEPEAIVTAEIEGDTYAFIGLERQGGIMVFNITDPANPVFETYERSNLVDISPEGMIFVPGAESPTGNDLIITSNEVSGTVAFYEVSTGETSVSRPLNVTAKADGEIINVTWDQDDLADGFNVYRSTEPDGGFSFAGFTNRNMLKDEAVLPSNTYFYYVTAVKSSIESASSDTVGVRTGTAPKGDIQMFYKGSYSTGLGEGAAEISSYDPISQRLAIVNAASTTVDILDISDINNPTLITQIDATEYGNGANSVVVAKGGVLAVAIENEVGTDPGLVAFFDMEGTFISQVTVGVLPDMLAITPDSTKILVANEGEPNDDYTIDPEGSVSVITLPADVSTISQSDVLMLDFNDFDTDSAALVASGVRIFGPGASVSQDLEPEYITVAKDGSKAFVALQENNALAVIDLSVDPPVISAIAPLGFKNHALVENAIDISDRDGGINITRWPLFGMYQPDAIASFEIGGMNYVVSANEGDARDYDGYSEEIRFGDLGDPEETTFTLDESIWPPAAVEFLQDNALMGRINITTATGDSDNDGDLDTVYIYGGRSFTIWDENGSLVWDSKNDFSLISAAQFPHLFNAQYDPEEGGYVAEDRSDNKGGEPEAVVTGVIDGRTYAFIGMERMGGVFVYDVTNPNKPQFELYEPAPRGDISPEGMLFLTPDQSPTGVPMLILSNEVSGTVSFYELTGEPFVKPEAPANLQASAKSTTSVRLEWTYPGAAEKYEIFRFDGEEFKLIATTTIPQYIDNDVVADELYEYYVKAVKSNRSSDPSDTVAVETIYTLQLLHASDLEGGVEAIQNAPDFAAIIDALEESFDNTVIISAGDNFIPGPFFGAASDGSVRSTIQEVNKIYFGNENLTNLREASGRIDISIMNIIGFDASAVGNHEFDAGTSALFEIIGTDIRGTSFGDVRWLGAQFPYLSSNLDFSGDDNLSGLFTDRLFPTVDYKADLGDLTATGDAPKIAPYTWVEKGGEVIGIVGATTQVLESITSNGGVEVIGTKTNDMTALADIIQPAIDTVLKYSNKVILVSHLQQIALEKELIGLLNGVDIVIAGGSDVLQANAGDILQDGDVAEEAYPFITDNADGDPAVVVGTDGEYSYVGRLVVSFDDNGILDVGSIDDAINGPYAAKREVVESLWDGLYANAFATDETKASLVKTLTEAVDEIVLGQDGNVFGLTDVFLEGRRNAVRTQETNLGNLTADANLWIAQKYDPEVAVSIKNGGGIRAAIGTTVEVSPGVYEDFPPQENPRSGKMEGEVSELDIKNSMRFNNSLSVLELSASDLKMVLEHAVAATAPGATPGQFAQVGGINFSFDPSLPSGERILNAVIVDSEGVITDRIVDNGVVFGDSERTIKVVTLNFLAGGGDSYPFNTLAENRVDLDTVTSVDFAGQASFGDFGEEQDALAEYMAEFYASTAFNMEETSPENDKRIQNLDFRADSLVRESQTITFQPIEDKLVTDDAFKLEASSSAGLSVTFEATIGSEFIEIFAGDSVRIDGAGTVTITATQEGDFETAPAGSVEQTFTISKLDQTITFPAINDVIISDGPVTLRATASSGLNVSYSVTTGTGLVSISGSSVSLLDVGAVTIAAAQPGNETYNAAASVSRSFNITSIVGNDDLSFGIYPNPTSDRLEISFGEVTDRQIRITDLSGKMIEQIESDEVRLELDMSKYSKGIYLIIVSTDGKKETAVIVKQ